MAASHSKRRVLHWREVLVVPPQRRRGCQGGELAERREADERGMSVRMVTRFVYVRVCGGLLEVPKALWRAVRFARECGGGVCCSRSCKGGRGRARRGCVARTGRRATQSYFLRPKREQEA